MVANSAQLYCFDLIQQTDCFTMFAGTKDVGIGKLNNSILIKCDIGFGLAEREELDEYWFDAILKVFRPRKFYKILKTSFIIISINFERNCVSINSNKKIKYRVVKTKMNQYFTFLTMPHLFGLKTLHLFLLQVSFYLAVKPSLFIKYNDLQCSSKIQTLT